METVNKKYKRNEKRAIMSFAIFLLCVVKYFIFNYTDIFPKYGDINRIISWIIVIPLMCIGLILSINVIFTSKKLLDILLSIPLILLIIYVFVI